MSIIRNKKAYDSGDVTAFINGIPVDIVDINYSKEKENQLNYKLNNKPNSWSEGKESFSASVTIMMDDIVPIEDAAGGDLTALQPFEINVAFTNKYNKVVVDRIIARFSKQGREVTGDMGLQMQYDLFAMDIEFNVNK
ncbi:MAG: hypothetical protein JXR60_12250 [Bacteroidales bacterium]|nr:hypothetical protein [Bacteroidales bacterium]